MVNADRDTGCLPGWVPGLACIAALIVLVWTVHGFNWIDGHSTDTVQTPAHHGHAKVSSTINPDLTPPTSVPTIQPVNGGALPAGPGAGPPPNGCQGFP
jgi:hypothetical protein